MRIAVCDDEKACIDSVVTVLEDYAIERRTDIDYETFERYPDLEDRVGEFDVFVMDYQTPEIDGLTFARKIREQFGEDKTIIFLTSYQEIVYDTFAVRAHRFLVKPVDKQKFFEALDAAVSNSNTNRNLAIKAEGRIELIPLGDILYVEVADKECYICLEEEQVVCRKPISQLEEELIPHGFFRVHRAYLVNMKKIRSFDQKEIEFTNGEKIMMSKRRYKEFCKAYLEFNE